MEDIYKEKIKKIIPNNRKEFDKLLKNNNPNIHKKLTMHVKNIIMTKMILLRI